MTTLRYYRLPSIKGEGWAHISINTETGFFATVSDWGNYAFLWTNPGGEFRAFLMKLEPDYLYGKLMMGRPDREVFDGKASKANIRQAIEEKNQECLDLEGAAWPHYTEELEALDELCDDPEKSDFELWEDETALTDVQEYMRYIPAHDCTGFCEKVWPRFRELLRCELEAERAKE